MRTAIYLRCSTAEQSEHGLSLGFQESACRVAAVKTGASSVQVFSDGGYSGTTLHRSALTELRSRLAEFDVIYVWKLDRLPPLIRISTNWPASITKRAALFGAGAEPGSGALWRLARGV